MKLTLQIKLLPDETQKIFLLSTLKEANAACNRISEVMWEKKIWNQFRVHHLVYHLLKETTRLSAQILIRCISKTVDAYKLDRKKKRTFRPLGGITYDSRILAYRKDLVSIWSVDGRLKIPFICHNKAYLPYVKGEADLILKKGKWYLFQTVEVPEDDVIDVEDFIGVDFGIINIATTSTGEVMSGSSLEQYRINRQRIRSSIQSKCTKGARKTLKRLSGKEKRHASIVNHTISKKLVEAARLNRKGIVLEDLKGIRKNTKDKRKAFRTRLGRWNFSQLKSFIQYKAEREGVPVILVSPRYTSQTCSNCFRIGLRQGNSFKCDCDKQGCGYQEHADINAARNLRLLGLSVNQPEQSVMKCAFSHS